MNKPLTILIIEDEPSECEALIQCIELKENLRLVGVTNNTTKAIEYIKDFQPDAIILDLELHKGHGNGLQFLELLQEIRLEIPVYVLVTTNNLSHVTHKGVRKMGADFIMTKSQADYSAQTVIDFLASLKNTIQSNKQVIQNTDKAEPPAEKQQRILNRAVTEINRIGIPPGATGRKYLLDAIIMVVNNQTEKIYSTIATKYTKSETSVERAMQIAIEKAWRTTDIEDLEKYYTARVNSIRGVPTIKEFVYYYGEKIKSEYQLERMGIT